jgi:hypothetical protein
MLYSVSTRFIDICTSDYVLDHCNGDNECLIGVSVGHDTKWESLLDDVMSEVWQQDKIPADVSDDMIKAEIESDVMRASNVVGSMTASGVFDNHDEDDEADYVDSDSMAWFRITWQEKEDNT